MAINISFNGATIYKPGAYSKINIDLGGGFPLSPTGLVAMIGEADRGEPGSAVPDLSNNVYTPEQIPSIQQEYGTGPIVDTASFLFAPATDGAIPSGAQAVYIYKTNASTRASLSIPFSYGTARSQEWGIGGNRITYKNVLISETPATTTGSVTVLSAAVDTGLALTLVIAQNGAAPVTHTIAASANRAALLSNLNAAFSGLTFTANGSDKIVITQNAGTNLQRNGWGRSIEVLSTSTALAAFGFVANMYTPAVEPAATITNSQKRDLITEQDTLGGNVTMSLGFAATLNDASAATVNVDATNLTLTVTGGTQAGVNTFPLNGFTAISQLVAAVGLVAGWTAEVTNLLYGQLPVTTLDRVVAIGALSSIGNEKPARIKKDASEVQNFYSLSSMTDLITPSFVGLPDALTESALSGGTKGATASSDITNALNLFTKIRVNSVVPLFSRDATADISDGLTDPSSTYTIAGVHQAVKTHCSLTATTKQKSERQGYLSLKDTYDNCKLAAQNLAYERVQLMIQDVRQTDSLGNIKWFQPYALAAMMAGARGGAPIGEPLTFKFMNVSGTRQTAQSMSTADQDIVNDFDPGLQYDDAIQNGLTFLERPQSGGFRVVVDNTTYGVDGNWVKNRGNVMYAADVLAFDFRRQLENIYVGIKNTVKAEEVKSVAASILATYLAQGITVSTPDAPNGFKQLVVQINGNTINISVIVKLVEGIDFVLADITLQRVQSVA